VRLSRPVLLTALLAIASRAHDARACSIVIGSETLPALAPAPLNAHVWIRHPPWRRSGNPSARRGAAPFDVDFVLRAVTPTAADVPVAVREWAPGVLVELVPWAPLPASHRFEVWAVPRGVERPRLVAFFQTGTGVDTTPPGRPSFDSVTRTKPPAHGIQIDCGPAAEIVLSGAGAPDSGDLLYAVWAAAGGRIAWDAPPIAVAGPAAPGQSVRFDVYDALRPVGDFVAWARSPSARIGVRALDVAGNLGPPVELDLR
jgi:hypothetical protein